ncbi:MAG: chemotaxis protein CheB [Chloroflexi bacterium]|nr:chemotaxis protein CheB [Chloroflexota bacterium]
MGQRDMIVIGASAGGVEILKTLVQGLPADLPAAIFVVLHITAGGVGALARILDRTGPLRARRATDGEPIVPGQIYVAPPDHHILVKEGHVHVTRGPKENRVRPAIDPLFRSAAIAYGSRVIGVILTGMLDDGTAGLLAVKSCGGVAIVQDPEDALFPGMPSSAIHFVDVDYKVPAAQIPALLVKLVQQKLETESNSTKHNVPQQLVTEEEIAEQKVESYDIQNHMNAKPSILSCPECGGTLWEYQDHQLMRYRCHVGHAFTARALAEEQEETLDRALWVAIRVLENRAALNHRMAEDARQRGLRRLARDCEERVQESEENATVLRDLLFHGRMDGPVDMEEAVQMDAVPSENSEPT